MYFFSYSLLLIGLLMTRRRRGCGLGIPASFYLLSIGGLPPLMGGLAKLVGIKALVIVSRVLLRLLVLSSIVRLAYYV